MARIVRAHGIRGEMRVLLYNPDSTLLRRGLQLEVYARDGAVHAHVIQRLRPQQQDLLLTLDGIDSRDAAEALHGAELRVARAALPPTDDDEYYAIDLVGCRVVDAQGTELGQVSQVSDNGAQDLLHVEASGGEWLLPLVDAYVDTVDLDARTVRVRQVAELIALGQAPSTKD
ncbi:MAG: ribosome maturation factor RimM [Pseudomonadota bacterium]